jgi:hypothetical protein
MSSSLFPPFLSRGYRLLLRSRGGGRSGGPDRIGVAKCHYKSRGAGARRGIRERPSIFTSVTAGQGHTCGITTARAVCCWGFGDDGELGDGTRTSHLTPTAIVQ